MGRQAAAISDSDRFKAFELFDQDATTNQVATQLFNKNHSKAKKLREAYDARMEPVPDAEPPDGEAEPEAWDVTLQVPVARMDEIMARFSAQEKAEAISAVLQARLIAEA